MYKRVILLVRLFLLAILWTPAAFGGETTTHPFDAVTLTEHVWANPPMRFYVVRVDLTNPRVHIRVSGAGKIPEGAGPWQTTLEPVSKIAEREHFDVAVNGSIFTPKGVEFILGRRLPYYEGNWARANGWTITDGKLWSTTPENAYFPSLAELADGSLTIGKFDAPPKGAREMVSGCCRLLSGGQVVAKDLVLSPRTTVGLDASDKTLTIMVVDGRRPDYSVGMSMKEAAEQLLHLGCAEAIDLDNGGSSTLVVRHGEKYPVISTPSDGHDLWIPISVERPVADALGVRVDK